MCTAALLGACQIIFNTLLIAIFTRDFVLTPHVFFGAQLYDFTVKLFAFIPGLREWLSGGALGRFLPPGFTGKLSIAAAFLLPNVAVLGVIAVGSAVIQWTRRRPPRASHTLVLLIVSGLLIEVVSLLLAIHVPDTWTSESLLRNTLRALLWKGAWLSLVGLALTGATTALFILMRPSPLRSSLVVFTAAATLILVATGRHSSDRVGVIQGGSNIGPTSTMLPVDNVILISIDSLRADRVGCYGNSRETSPVMDELAQDGVRFATAMSTTSWTLPSHVSLLTGRYLLSHGVITRNDVIPDAVPTLAELLHNQGVETGAVVSAPLLRSRYGFARGFNEYDESCAPSRSTSDLRLAEPAPRATELAINWLRRRGGKPFFFFLHYWDVHYDYAPPPPYDTMFDPDYTGSVTGDDFYNNPSINCDMAPRDMAHLLALYDGEIRWVDYHIGRLLDALEELGLAEHTALIVTSDHGDEFFEHGYKGHTRTLYTEVVDVPLIARVPGVLPGRVIETPVSLVDILPTILALFRAPLPPEMDGQSLLPAMVGGKLADRPAVYSWLCNSNEAAYCQAMQHTSKGDLLHVFQPLRIEFYRPDDPLQQHDVADSSAWGRREQMSLLRAALNDQWTAHRALGTHRRTLKLDKATRERLRALGYGD